MTRASLCGDNLVRIAFLALGLVRIAFLDEAGRSRHEPIIVVAGPIVHGDRTYRQLVQRLRDVIDQFIPEADRQRVVFHTKDIFHGSGYFHRDRWSQEKRRALLHALASIPQTFGLPIAFGYYDKAEAAEQIAKESLVHQSPRRRGHFADAIEHALAFIRAEVGIEQQMHQFPRDEICMIIAEDTDRVRRVLRDAHSLLRDPLQVLSDAVLSRMPELPLRKIEDTPHFAAKADSAPLQVADMCAFLIRRRLERREDSQAFFEAIAPQLIWKAPAFGEPMGAEQIAMGSRY